MSITRMLVTAARTRLRPMRPGARPAGVDAVPLDWRVTPGCPIPDGVVVVDLADSPNHFPGRFLLPPETAAEIAGLVARAPGIPARHLRPITGASILPWGEESWLKVRRGLVWDDELAYDGRRICELLEQFAPEQPAEATHHCLWGRCFRWYE